MNLLERPFNEERGRLEMVANAFGEKLVQKLMFSSLVHKTES
jgi:hypothetical protein